MTTEKERLLLPGWRNWGPYVSNRQWGTVREDYSANGDAWNYTTHDMARSKTYRWGEEGIGGISDEKQFLCFSLALWNKKDPIIKEIFYGLTNEEGNHGEDIKELFYYLDSTPTHSYMKMLYKYPQSAYPYEQLKEQNQLRGKTEPEYELLDTGALDNDRYFDVFIEYAKASTDDILVRITVHNRGNEDAPLSIIPTLWFRNTWSWNEKKNYQPELFAADNCIRVHHQELNIKTLHFQEGGDLLFCDNETNTKRLYNIEGGCRYSKDGINDHIINGADTVNPDRSGTKAAIHYNKVIPAAGSITIELRLSDNVKSDLSDFNGIVEQRKQEANDFYGVIQKDIDSEDERLIHRQAIAGLLWNKQFYYYNVQQWLEGDPLQPTPPEERKKARNHDWKHMNGGAIILMPDKWEYPWFAAWDLAFHCITLSTVDIDFAKEQLLLLTREWYMHPNGTLPAYEWSFGDANPPVHAWAAWEIYYMEQSITGTGDSFFLESIFHKLLINFTWWVNRKDAMNNNIFEGGFLGLDNIGVFNRNATLPDGAYIEQSDGTSWMAMFALNMMHIALELAYTNKTYVDMANKFFEHFLYIAGAMTNMGNGGIGLWDNEDEFFYDQLHLSDTNTRTIKLRSMVGLIPMFAVEILDKELLDTHPEFVERMQWFLENKPELANLVSRWTEEGTGEKYLLSLLRGHRLKRILKRMLDEDEFLSDSGIRALSKHYDKQPFAFETESGIDYVQYEPAESDSNLFGGNSNWRGPVWFPVNYLIILSIKRFHHYFGNDFTVEYPTGSGNYLTLQAIAMELTNKIVSIFTKEGDGKRKVFGDDERLQHDPNFKDYILFHEYFHGDTGKGLGAAHQTGWTALVANLILQKNRK